MSYFYLPQLIPARQCSEDTRGHSRQKRQGLFASLYVHGVKYLWNSTFSANTTEPWCPPDIICTALLLIVMVPFHTSELRATVSAHSQGNPLHKLTLLHSCSRWNMTPTVMQICMLIGSQKHTIQDDGGDCHVRQGGCKICPSVNDPARGSVVRISKKLWV